jgi:hypothetical protein
LWDNDNDEKIILKWRGSTAWKFYKDSTGLGYVLVVDYCGYGNGHFGFIKDWEFLYQLNDY